MDFSQYGEEVRSWLEEIQKNRGVDAEVTLQCCSRVESYALENNDEKLLGVVSYYAGETYYLLNDGDDLFKYITRAISYLDQAEEWELVARSYNILAITSVNRGNAPIAMDYYLNGLNYCRKYHLDQVEMILNLNLGSLYLYNEQYQEAQKYFEDVLTKVRRGEPGNNYYSILNCIYTGLGRCCIFRGMTEKAREYLELLDRECGDKVEGMDRLCALCFKAAFYHTTGRSGLRDWCIEEVHEGTSADMPVMDIFEDYYSFCQLLLDIEKDDVFWDIIRILEELCKNAGIVNLQRRIISLKLKYYRMHRENGEYLQAAGLYYELMERMERENRFMISKMLGMRSALERANAKRRQVEEENIKLQRKSETDPLTRLPNRFRLNAYSEGAFERAMRQQTPLAVEILDIDFFKQYNDNYGHQAGDECIVAIAQQLQQLQSDRIFCARYGGDEFIVIYEDMTEQAVRGKSEELREKIMGLRIAHEYSPAFPIVTISQGICYDIPRGDNKNWDFLHCADAMLYRVKKESRNSISLGYLNTAEN